MLKRNRDFLNSDNKRNERNTSELQYNCGGYALGTYSWYSPYDSHSEVVLQILDNLGNEKILWYKILKNLGEEHTKQLLIDFPNLKRGIVNNSKKIILYRLGLNLNYLLQSSGSLDYNDIDFDFHFIIYDKDTKKATHKMGAEPIEEISDFSLEEFLNDEIPWDFDDFAGLTYNSPVFSFSK